MANWGEWQKALENAGITKYSGAAIPTVEIYSQIKSMGLATVEWLSFWPEQSSEIASMRMDTRQFIQTNAPCLFIFEPKDLQNSQGLKKGYLFNVQNFSEVEKWISDNTNHLLSYAYLVTTQISNGGNGFVGNVFSDGVGNLICETLHKPGVSNSRELSQPKESFSVYLDFFITREFEIKSHQKKWLDRALIQQILSLYESRSGYFEFVYGTHLGKTGFFTTGFVPLSKVAFPTRLWEQEFYHQVQNE